MLHVLVVLCICSCVFSLPIEGTHQVTLKDIISSTSKLIEYYTSNYHNMNLDGIYGLRLLEGQLLKILEDEDITSDLSASNHQILQKMYSQASHVANQSMQHVERDDPKYFEQLKPLIDRPAILQKEYRRVDISLEWPPGTASYGGAFSEEFSDRCMRELTGDGVHDDTKCLVSPQCLQVMTTKGMLEYHITHQLLYTMLAEQCNCVDNIESYLDEQGLGADLDFMQLEFCSNNFLEMAQSVQELGGKVMPIYQDLFLEQEFVCAQLGFMEFLHNDWLLQILQWQKPNGCFGKMHKSNPVHIPEKHNKHFYNPSRELFRGKTKNPGINQNDPQTKGPLLSNSNVVVQENLDGMNSLVLHKQNNSTQNHNIKPLDTKLADINLNAFKQGIPDKDTQHGMPHKPLIDLINHQEQQQQQPFMPDGGNMHIHDNGPLKFPIRRLLEEKELDDGCLAHKTAVAAGALSQYLRFAINPGSFEYSREVNLHGNNYMMLPFEQLRDGTAIGLGKDKIVKQIKPKEKLLKMKRNDLDYDKSQVEKEIIEEYYEYYANSQADKGKGKNDFPEDSEENNDQIFDPFEVQKSSDLKQELEESEEDEEFEEDIEEKLRQKSRNNGEYEQYLDDYKSKDPHDPKYHVLDPPKADLKGKAHKDSNNAGDNEEDGYYNKENQANTDTNGQHYDSESEEEEVFNSHQQTVHLKKISPDNSLHYTYAVVLTAMFLLLYMIFRFVRKRRILIRYRFR